MSGPSTTPETVNSDIGISDSAALLELSSILNASLDLDFILGNVLLSIMGKCLISRAFAFVEEDGHFKLLVKKGLTTLDTAIRFELRVGWDRPLEVADIDPRGDDDLERLKALCKKHRITMLAPMMLDGCMVGLIGVGDKTTGESCSNEEHLFLESVAAIAAAAIGHALVIDALKHTNRRLDRKVQELNTLFELSREMNAMFDETRILRTLSYALMGQLRITHFVVYIRTGRVFNPVFVRHPAFKPNKRMQRGIGKLHVPINFADEKCAMPPVATWLQQSGFRAIIPMRMQNQTEGLLCVGDRMGSDELDPTDIEYMSLLSSITIASIFSTRLLKETLEKQHMEEELQLARSIQKGLLPSTLPTIGPYCIFGMNESSLQVGGDYYDVIPVSDHELVIAIGDVSGKGIPASLLMANVQAALRTIAPLRLPLPDATQRLNTIVYRNTGADRFITFFWGVLDTKTHTFEYLNAGHNPPYLVRENGGFVQLNAGGLILGVLPDVPHYDTETVTINPGDTLYMYTDGVNEALSKTIQEYGNERLEHMLDRCRKARPQELAEAITRDIRKFTVGAGQSDDITMLIIKRQLEQAGV